MNQSTNITLQNVLNENDLCEFLGMTKNQIGDLRRKKCLPFIKLGQRSRLYFEHDLIKYFEKNRIILNESETE